MAVQVRIAGIDDLRAQLAAVVPKLRYRALLSALRKASANVRLATRLATPQLKASTYAGASALRRGVRAVGTVRKAISIRSSKRDRARGDVGVFVNVRQAGPGKRGAKKPTDPFYWRFLQFGWTPRGGKGGRLHRMLGKGRGAPKPGAHFLERGAQALPGVLPAFSAAIGPAIARLNQRNAPAP